MSQHELHSRLTSYLIRCASAVGLVMVILYTQAFVQ